MATLAVLVSGFTIATVGVPPFLVLMGVWSFSAITNRWVSALSGPASWAAGVIVEAISSLGLHWPEVTEEQRHANERARASLEGESS